MDITIAGNRVLRQLEPAAERGRRPADRDQVDTAAHREVRRAGVGPRHRALQVPLHEGKCSV